MLCNYSNIFLGFQSKLSVIFYDNHSCKQRVNRNKFHRLWTKKYKKPVSSEINSSRKKRTVNSHLRATAVYYVIFASSFFSWLEIEVKRVCITWFKIYLVYNFPSAMVRKWGELSSLLLLKEKEES